MENDAFTGGIEPCGLRSKNDIGILICYILDYINKPFSKDDLVEVIQENGLANYFETHSAITELEKCGNICFADEAQKTIQITDNGKLISSQLHTSLSPIVRQRAVSAATKLIARRKIERENPVEIRKAEGGGYQVTLRITDNIRDLMALTLFMPDITEANAVKQHFHQFPEKIYSVVLASVIGDKSMIEQAMKELR